MQDLWADFADEARTTAEVGRGRGLRQRRLTEQTAVMTLRAWLLRDYLFSYGASLGATRIFKRCYWIDGLGNTRQPAPILPTPERDVEPASTRKRGRQAKKNEPRSTEHVSPALQLATNTARELARLERPLTLYPFLLDEKRAPRKGEAALQSHNDSKTHATLMLPKEGGVLPALWSEVVSDLLPTLEQSAAVFLLNPLKDGLFRYTDLSPLYQRAAPTELFLWLSHKQIETRLLPGLRTSEGAAALTNLLRGDRWKSRLTQGAEQPERLARELVELLAESMRPHFLSVQHLSIPILSGPATVENAPYSLLFATRRQDSLYSLNDAVCQRAHYLLTESQRGVLSEEWFVARREAQAATRRDTLAQELLTLGRLQRARRWPDLRQQLLLAHFGQHTLADYDTIIARLLEEGAVRCEWRKRAPANDAPTIPSTDDLLLWK
jgi:hypothetical protein